MLSFIGTKWLFLPPSTPVMNVFLYFCKELCTDTIKQATVHHKNLTSERLREKHIDKKASFMVVEEFEKGFKLGEKVIRFSIVKVAN